MLATTGPSVLWYLARGSGLAALVVLTVSMVLGIVTSVRWSNPRWPRFVIELVHRNSSLLAFALIVVHVATVVLDAFAPIGWKDTVIPFVSAYRPVWLGLGAAAFDVLVAVLVTSLLRHRMSHRTWRVVHWFAYLCWPLVIVHGLGTGSDAKVGFVLVLYVVCIGAVIASAWWRLAVGWPDHAGIRVSGLLASVLAPVVLVAWLASGPLASGWASKAGTPASVLAKLTPASASSSVASSPATSPAASPASGVATPPFSAQVAGSISQSDPAANGRVTVRLATSLSGGATGVLTIVLVGQPVEGGGVLLETSQVTFGPASQAGLYHGAVVALRGTQIVADLQSAGRTPLTLTVNVNVDSASSRVSGSLQARSGTAGGGVTPGGGQ